MSAIALSSKEVAAIRLGTHGLLGEPRRSAAETVRHLLAVQGQDWPASRWAVGVRSAGATDADVLAAFDRGEIVRSWPMRGTVHITTAEDLRWLLELTGVRALSGLPRRWAALGIDEPYLEAARDVATELLRNGGTAKRSEFSDALSGAGLEVSGGRLYHCVWYLSQTGSLVHGPTLDGEHRLVLADEWLPDQPARSRSQSLGELTVRYLASHGPATVDDLVWWTKLTKSDIRGGLEEAGDALVQAVHADDRRELWLTEAALGYRTLGFRSSKLPTLALPAFDEHLLGYSNRNDVLDPGLARAVDPARNGVFRYTIVDGGRVVATWRRVKRTRDVVVHVDAFAPMSKAARSRTHRSLRRWAAFTGRSLGSVSF